MRDLLLQLEAADARMNKQERHLRKEKQKLEKEHDELVSLVQVLEQINKRGK